MGIAGRIRSCPGTTFLSRALKLFSVSLGKKPMVTVALLEAEVEMGAEVLPRSTTHGHQQWNHPAEQVARVHRFYQGLASGKCTAVEGLRSVVKAVKRPLAHGVGGRDRPMDRASEAVLIPPVEKNK